jgi:hypothetical protein
MSSIDRFIRGIRIRIRSAFVPGLLAVAALVIAACNGGKTTY